MALPVDLSMSLNLILRAYSSVGRALVSKTRCRGFKSFYPCQKVKEIPKLLQEFKISHEMRNCLNIIYYAMEWKKPSMVFCETLNTECNEVIVIELLQIWVISSVGRAIGCLLDLTFLIKK